ncbi:thrombomodulin-like [Antennarius striatus]|uniref:thrombomodulin-like n=1 Tax=Antennarius striatus TaxID=241820 RepID=UPI0035B43ADF
MIRSSNALLVCVIFLCGLEEAVLSPRGHCAGSQCFALFQESEDFQGAQERCKDSGGHLLKFTLSNVLTVLPGGVSGSYWLELHTNDRTTEEAAFQQCSCVSVSMEQNVTVQKEPCSDNLDGFLCQYTSEEQCGSLQAGGGIQVRYTAPMGFDLTDSETFPPGTIAVAEKAGAIFPDSKHVCVMTAWTKAPWTCEVFRGGCEHDCNSTTHDCICPAGQTLHPNRITCTADPCAKCAQGCQQVGDTRACKCNQGYRLAEDGIGCEDVDECAEENPCTGDGEECENTVGDFECRCGDGFEEEDGVCVDVSVCQRCEHMLCDKVNGVYECMCRKGFRVSPADRTRCVMTCTEAHCPASCVLNHENKLHQCFCPDGYIIDMDTSTPTCYDINECELEKQCEHKCENLFGGYRCLCDEGFKLHKSYMCVAIEDEEEEEEGSGSTAVYPTPAGIQPPAVPSYIKTGSILGISVSILLAAALLFFLIQHSVKRCGSFQLPSIKHSNLDIFYLQQVTTETYKRLSFDKQFKNDAQIL